MLGDAIGTDHMTVARMLGTTSGPCSDHPPEVWVVDEASMLGARDAEALLAQAGDFAALSREESSRTLVLDLTRKDRQELTDAIRAALIRNGTLGEDAIVATVLELRGLTCAEARLAAS